MNNQTPAYILQPETFLIHRDGISIDLTPLLAAGAKHTVLYAALAAALHIPAKIPSRRPNDPLRKYAKYNEWLYRTLNRYVRIGLLERHENYIDTCSIDPTQRPGLFWRATPNAYQKTPNLIDGMQNSKSFANDTTTPREHVLHTNAKFLIPERCSWLRAQAIRSLANIKNAAWFIRDKITNTLNPSLTVSLNRIDNIFREWDKDCLDKKIILRNLKLDEYATLPYKTRFNDDGRKLKNVKIYNTGIENSLKKYKTGVFLTLTTDPLIWMSPKGTSITRHIKSGSKTYHFDGTGQGADLYTANRHESQAWRKWYEKICHRYDQRVPYIRCVEFQKNGLIHTHILLFGIEWNTTWEQFAKEWGTQYNQGYLNKAYDIINDGEKWTWKQHKPADSKGRAPADYLKKYLIKSMYETKGFFMYWACNKRFFTMSETLRYYSFDEKIAEEQWLKEHQPPNVYEFVGSSSPDTIPQTIRTYLRKKYGKPQPKVFDFGNPQKRNEFGLRLCEILWHPGLRNPPKPKEPAPEPHETTYDKQLEEEALARAERRRKLREKTAGTGT